MSAENKTRELVVIGAGTGGYPAAFHAADLGMKVTLIDPEANPGGVCLYRGCIPSKALLHVENFVHEAQRAARWGVSTGEVRADVEQLRAWKQGVVEKLTSGLGQLVKARKIDYVRGTASFLDRHTLRVQPHEAEAFDIGFEQAIIATGSTVANLPFAPDSDRIMRSSEALDLPDAPKRLLVVGGGYIGLELGQVYAALGSKVTVVEMLDSLLPGVDPDLVSALKSRLEEQFHAIHLKTSVSAMKATEKQVKVTLKDEDGKESQHTFDRVLVAVGRNPNTQGLGLDNTQVQLSDKGFIVVDEQRRTAEPHIFAVGDVVGEPMLAHKASHEGYVAAEVAAGNDMAFEPAAIPFVVFSNPSIAWCGLSEREARDQGFDIAVAKFPWSASGRAVTLDRTDGLTKLIIDNTTGRLLGVGLAGVDVGELVGQGVLALEMGAVVEDLALTIQAHPTLSETLKEAAEKAADGRSIHHG